jgi:hypothetical protein
MAIPAKPKGKSHFTKLINLTLASGAELFRSPEGDLYATVSIGETKETLLLTEKPFRNWLARAYFIATKGGVSGGAIADAVMALSGSAYASGRIHSVYTRVAAFPSSVYLDLCRDDRQVLAILPEGWSVMPAPDQIRFVRRSGTLPLPTPIRAGRSLTTLLPSVINISPQGPSPMLLTAWLIGCLRGLKPFPILVVTGEHGTGKTSACRTCRLLIDPSQANLSLTPKEPRDLVIQARNAHVLGFDNLSFIQDWLSDALCAIATGAGFRTRTLTTDTTETIFSSANPIVLNSIADIVRRGDLMDRAITIALEPISDAERRTEADMEAMFRAVQPEILGGLADAVSHALRHPVTLKTLPRMADFATTVESAAPALDWKPGAFLKAYAENRETAVAAMVDGDLLIGAMQELKTLVTADQDGKVEWVHTSTELWKSIALLIDEARKKEMPKTPQLLIGHLRRLAPTLRSLGIHVQEPKVERVGEKLERLMRIEYVEIPKDCADPQDAPPAEIAQHLTDLDHGM